MTTDTSATLNELRQERSETLAELLRKWAIARPSECVKSIEFTEFIYFDLTALKVQVGFEKTSDNPAEGMSDLLFVLGAVMSAIASQSLLYSLENCVKDGYTYARIFEPVTRRAYYGKAKEGAIALLTAYLDWVQSQPVGGGDR